jgi:DNA-binding MarR family transcriptional regulator
MKTISENLENTRFELANRIFFRLYQCANMLHKTGTRAVEAEGLTTQQWAIMGALSRQSVRASLGGGMAVGDLARYLMVSRQNLAGLVQRMVRNRHIEVVADQLSRRNKVIRLTPEGDQLWSTLAQPKIRGYYQEALSNFSTSDLSHSLHYLLKLLSNMQDIDLSSSLEAPPKTRTNPTTRPPRLPQPR